MKCSFSKTLLSEIHVCTSRQGAVLVLCGAMALLALTACTHGPKGTTTSKPVQTQAKVAPLTIEPGKTVVYAGLPQVVKYPNSIQVIHNEGFVVGYDNVRKNPAWVAYRLVPVAKPAFIPVSELGSDPRTSAMVKSEDYLNTGYRRGELAPPSLIGICYGAEAQAKAARMSNIIPEMPNVADVMMTYLNRREWDAYVPKFNGIWVVTGPIYGKPVIKFANGLQVPQAVYKIILVERNGKADVRSFIIPQDITGAEKPAKFLVSVEQIENQTGLKFFNELSGDVAKALKAEVPEKLW
jgi:endonuclease G